MDGWTQNFLSGGTMATRKTWLSRLFAPLALLGLPGCAAGDVASAPPVPQATGPALWKVADEDTTIFLFGTIHALPADVQWYDGEIASALAGSQLLVTEIPANSANLPGAQASIAQKALLPEGQSLRDLLSDSDRAVYEAALGRLGLPPASFDPFEPWFAGMILAVLPLKQSGYQAETGVEKVVDGHAGPTKERAALESIEAQIDLFDQLPQKAQVEFLMASARDLDGLVAMMNQMVAEWLAGDADDLAELMNRGLSDPVLAKALLYDRNARWAEWIDQRMDQPGQVFVAVGAGHLAGQQSVQTMLESRGFTVTRVQ